jgi:hypothetical protein
MRKQWKNGFPRQVWLEVAVSLNDLHIVALKILKFNSINVTSPIQMELCQKLAVRILSENISAETEIHKIDSWSTSSWRPSSRRRRRVRPKGRLQRQLLNKASIKMNSVKIIFLNVCSMELLLFRLQQQIFHLSGKNADCRENFKLIMSKRYLCLLLIGLLKFKTS